MYQTSQSRCAGFRHTVHRLQGYSASREIRPETGERHLPTHPGTEAPDPAEDWLPPAFTVLPAIRLNQCTSDESIREGSIFHSANGIRFCLIPPVTAFTGNRIGSRFQSAEADPCFLPHGDRPWCFGFFSPGERLLFRRQKRCVSLRLLGTTRHLLLIGHFPGSSRCREGH